MYYKKNKTYKLLLEITIIILPTLIYYLTKIDIKITKIICSKLNVQFNQNLTPYSTGFGYEITIILLTFQLSLLLIIIYNCNKKINMIK